MNEMLKKVENMRIELDKHHKVLTETVNRANNKQRPGLRLSKEII